MLYRRHGGIIKTNSEVVDDYNVFRNMKRALSDYALGDDQDAASPVQDKSNLFILLDDALQQGMTFCETLRSGNPEEAI